MDKKEKALTRDDLQCPDGWLWKGEWLVDKNRAVDEDGGQENTIFLTYKLFECGLGWEYAIEAGTDPWVPYERNVHLCRRRRWVRLRSRDNDSTTLQRKRVCIDRASFCILAPTPSPLCYSVRRKKHSKKDGNMHVWLITLTTSLSGGWTLHVEGGGQGSLSISHLERGQYSGSLSR